MTSLESFTTLHPLIANTLLSHHKNKKILPSNSEKNKLRCFSRISSSSDITSVKNNNIEAQEQLPEKLRPELMPKHVAIIMDGNRRWAHQRNLSVFHGHIAGKEALRKLVRLCSKWGIQVLSVFAFSTENWSRPKEEVIFLMQLMGEVAKSELEEFVRSGYRVSVIGDRTKLSKSLQEYITQAEEITKANSGILINFAVNYGGQYDIVQACKAICRKTMSGQLHLDDINETVFERELETKCTKEFHNPELLIRTSGEHRLSNFFLWQLAYSELYFADKMFPDFGEEDFIEALSSFQKRHRRFGGHKY